MKPLIHRRVFAVAVAAAFVAAGLVLPGPAQAAAVDESKDGDFSIATFADYPDSSTPLSLRTALSGNFVSDDVTLRLGSSRKATLPAGDEYGWLGKAGDPGWYTGSRFASPQEQDVPLLNPDFLVDRSQLAAGDTAQQLGVQKVAGPGTFAWYEAGLTGAAGTSAAPVDGLRLGTGSQRDGTAQNSTVTLPDDTSSFQSDMVARFGAAGMYCITFAYSAHPASSASRLTVTDTVRVAVGDSVAADAPCGTVGDGGGTTPPGGGTTPPGGGTTPPTSGDPNAGIGPDGNRIWTSGHVDALYPTIGTAADGTQKLALQALDSKVHDLDDTVYYSSDVVQKTLPATYTKNEDYSFIGKPGQTVWNSPQDPIDGAPWMGLSTQSDTLNATGQVAYHFRLDAVTGPGGAPAPGDVALWSFGAEAGVPSSLYASTRVGLPNGWQSLTRAHSHFNWAFTKPGVYCLAFSVEAPMPDGTRQSDSQQLTMAVGSSVDPKTVRPCGHTQPYPTPPGGKSVVADTGAKPVLIDRGSTAFAPRLVGGALSVGLRRDDSYYAAPGRTSDIDDTIVHVPFGNDLPYTIDSAATRDDGLQLGWDATGVAPGAVRGGLTWKLDPRGPGGISTTEYGPANVHPFDTITGTTTSRELWPGTQNNLTAWNTARPGKYCVGMTWSATLADGTPVSDHHVLTVVVDGPLDPKKWAYNSDPNGSKLVATGPVFTHKADTLTTTCADGAQPTTASEVPVDGTGKTPPTSGGGGTRPVSGRDVLRVGHMDVLSTVTQAASGNTLGVRIHDDNTSPASLHDPNKSTFYAAEAARTVIPPDAKFRFLGTAGRPVWVLPQTQDPKLLWPGWNVDLTRSPAAKNVQWTLNSVKGPGAFALFENTGFGDVKVLLDSDGAQKSFAYHEHAHANWAFGADGVYCLDSTFAAQPSSLKAAQRTTLLVAVGNVDPARVTPADCGKSAAQVGTGTNTKPTGTGNGTGTADPLGATLDSVAHHGAKSNSAQNLVTADPCTAQQVRSSRRGRVDVASSGHFDFGSRVIDNALVAAVKDGRKEPATWRDTAGLVFDVGSAAKQSVPAGYPFLGRAGGSVWVIPQTQLPNIPWLGWNTQDPSVISGTTGPVTFSVTGLSGPGKLAVYTTGSFGGVEDKIFGTAAGFPRSFTVAPNVHAHANWAFTEPGVYRLNMTQTATLRGGTRSSGSATLTFSVGRADPSAAAPTVVTTRTVGRTSDGQACTLSASQLRTASTGFDVRTGLLLSLGALVAGAVTVAASRRGRRRPHRGRRA